MLIIVGMRNVISCSSRGLISNPLAFKPENVTFFPFFAKNQDVTPPKNAKIGQKINFPQRYGNR